MYNTTQEVLTNLRQRKTNIPSVNRQMLRCFKKRDIERWVMFAKAKTIYQMEKEDGDESK